MPELPQEIPKLIAGLLQRSDGLPALPQIVAELQRTLTIPNVNMKMVATVIEKDAGLTLQVLKVANSAFYGFTGKVSTVPLACTLLGQDTIEGLVTSMSVMKTLKAGADAHFDPMQFWTHSVLTGLCAQDLADRFHYGLRGDVLTCGILHDIGKIVTSQFLHPQFVQVIELHRTGVPYREAEMRILGADHTMVGCWVSRHWKLPEIFSECILKHHDWPDRRDSPLEKRIAATYLGNVIAHMTEYKQEKGKYPVLRPEFVEKFGVTQVDTEKVADAALEKARQILPDLLSVKKTS